MKTKKKIEMIIRDQSTILKKLDENIDRQSVDRQARIASASQKSSEVVIFIVLLHLFFSFLSYLRTLTMYSNKKNEHYVPKNKFKQLSSRVNKIESSIGILSSSVCSL